MVTPLIILGLLVGPYFLTKFLRLTASRAGLDVWSGCLGTALVFAFTGIGHFIKSQPMTEMLPKFVPGRLAMVYITGVIELAAAVLVLVPKIRRKVGWGLIVIMIAFMPVNVYAAIDHVGMGGHAWGPIYLLVRVPLQVILIAWIWWFVIQSSKADDKCC